MAGLEEEQDSLLDDLFGVTSKVQYEVFVEKMISDVKWAFDAVQIRKRIFNTAEIKERHITK